MCNHSSVMRCACSPTQCEQQCPFCSCCIRERWGEGLKLAKRSLLVFCVVKRLWVESQFSHSLRLHPLPMQPAKTLKLTKVEHSCSMLSTLPTRTLNICIDAHENENSSSWAPEPRHQKEWLILLKGTLTSMQLSPSSTRLNGLGWVPSASLCCWQRNDDAADCC